MNVELFTAFAFVVVKPPPTVTVPEDNVKIPFAIRVLLEPILETIVKVDERVSEAIVEVRLCVRVALAVVGAVLFPTTSVAAAIDPAPLIVPVAFAVARLTDVIDVVTVNKIPEFTVSVEPLPIVMELQV